MSCVLAAKKDTKIKICGGLNAKPTNCIEISDFCIIFRF